MSATDLKPCPFCGESAAWEPTSEWTECGHCAATGSFRDLWKGDWNTRPIEDSLRARAEAAEAAAARWRIVRDLVHKIDAEARPGGVMADDDVLDIVYRVLRHTGPIGAP
jgi:hypothetical protein